MANSKGLLQSDDLSLMDEYRKKILMAGLLSQSEGGIAPYGLRHSGESAKGKGYFGPLPTLDGGGVSTEISSEDDLGEFPLMVPTLSKDEINHLLSGAEPTDSIYGKAISWANSRRKQGLSPFASQNDIKVPVGLLD
jgi:hypothetical protein